MLKSLERLSEELSRTAVISEDFKTKIITYAQSVAQEAYQNGRKRGLKEAKKSEPKVAALLRQWVDRRDPPCVCTHEKKCLRCEAVELLG